MLNVIFKYFLTLILSCGGYCMARNRKKSKENKILAKYEKLLDKRNYFDKKDLTPYSAALHMRHGGDLNDYIIFK